MQLEGTKSDLLTNSRKSAARRCDRLHHYLYNLGYRPIHEDAEARHFGSLFHELRHRYFQYLMDQQADRDPNPELWAPFARDYEDQDPHLMAKLRATFMGYVARWYGEDMQDVILGVEEPFKYPHTNPETNGISRTWKEAGVTDSRRMRAGRHLFDEAKTTSDDITPGSEYWRRLRMDTQIAQYNGASYPEGPFDGCLYDVVKKVELRPLQATPVEKRKYRKDDGKLYANMREHDEAPEEYYRRCMEAISEDPELYYQRGEYYLTESDALESKHEAWLTGRRIADNLRQGTHPRNPDSCRKWGRLCPFFNVCVGDSELSDPMLFEEVSNVHPELEE